MDRLMAEFEHECRLIDEAFEKREQESNARMTMAEGESSAK